MNNFYKFYLTVLTSLVVTGLCYAHKDGENEIRINNVGYLNGQTVYIDCSVTSVRVTAGVRNAYGLVPESWNVSSNLSYQYAPTVSEIILTLDPNREDGRLTANLYGSQVTIIVSQKPTPSLTIAPTLCSSGQSGDFSVTLNYYGPNQANVVWETTGGITVNGSSFYRVTGNTISRATVQHNSYGTLVVYGEVPGCNNMRTKPATQYIGAPSGSVSFVGNPDPGSSLCGGQTYSFASNTDLPTSQFSYSWSIPMGSNDVGYFYGSGPNVSVAPTSGPNPGGFLVQMNVTNIACGTTGSTSRTFMKTNCGGYYRVANNPTSNTVTVLLDPVDDVKYLPISLRLSHEKAGIVKEVNVDKKLSNDDVKGSMQVEIDVQDLPKDTYYLQGVYQDGKVQNVRVVIQ